MAAPGANIRFMGVDSSLVDLTEKKSGKANNKTEYFSLTDLNTNFANTDLTFTGDRSHNTGGNYLEITTDNGGYTEGYFYIGSATKGSPLMWAGYENQFIEATATDLTLYYGNLNRLQLKSTELVINDTGASYDTRIEGDTDTNLFFVDASTDRVGIGTSSPGAKLHVAASGSSHYLTVQSTTLNNAGLRAYNTVADWRYICNSSGDLQIYDQTSVATPLLIKQGAPNYSMYFATTEVIINQNAANLDFRVEGQTDANLLFTDASTDRVGIGTSTPSYKLDVNGSGIFSDNTSTITKLGVQTLSGSVGQFSGIGFATSATVGRFKSAIAHEATGSAFGVGDLVLYVDQAVDSGVVSSTDDVLRLDRFGSQILGSQAALSTTATDGFTYIPTCAGTPTGTPTAYTGKVPMVYDTTNSIMYVYTGGAWVAV